MYKQLMNIPKRLAASFTLCVLVFALVFVPTINALPQEDTEAINRDSVHYLETDSGCSPGSVSEGADGSTSVCCLSEEGSSETVTLPASSKGSAAEKVFVFLVQKGLTAKQAVGIVGNLMDESGGGEFNLNPKVQNEIGAYGIAQWLGGRKANLMKKPNHDTLEVQMDFMWQELNTDYKASTLDPIKASTGYTGPKGSVRIFLENYEIPCMPGPACNSFYESRKKSADKAYAAFKDLAPADVATDATDDCGDVSGDVTVDPNGYAFPIVLSKNDVSNGYSWPCRTSSPYCHHDGTAAFDLAKKALDDSTAGVEIVAVYDGAITNINPNYNGTGCQSIQFKGKDGWYYWYGHIRTDSKTPKVGQAVKAGAHLGKVGERVCTGNGSYPHLHIDRGSPKGRTAGEDCCRDKGFLSLMNELYKNLP